MYRIFLRKKKHSDDHLLNVTKYFNTIRYLIFCSSACWLFGDQRWSSNWLSTIPAMMLREYCGKFPCDKPNLMQNKTQLNKLFCLYVLKAFMKCFFNPCLFCMVWILQWISVKHPVVGIWLTGSQLSKLVHDYNFASGVWRVVIDFAKSCKFCCL